MKRKIISFKKYLDVNKKLFVFLTSIMLTAIIAGSVFSLTLNKTDASLVSEFLSNYLENVTNSELSLKTTLTSVIVENLTITTLIFFLAYSIVGIPIMILLFFYKSFIIGFSISNILLNYKLKGIILSILYVFPHQIMSVLLLITFIVKSIALSLNLVSVIFFKNNNKINNLNFFKTYLLVSFLIFLFSLYEILVLPLFLKIILNIG